MNNLEDTLTTLDGPVLDLPATAILARGDRIRRRRRTLTTLAGAAGVVALAAAAYVVVPEPATTVSPIASAPPASGRIDPEGTVDWSGGPTNLSDAELAQLSESCLTSAYETEPLNPDSVATGEIAAGTLPIVAERRDVGINALFAGNGHFVKCSTPGGMPEGHDFTPSEASGRIFAMSNLSAGLWPEAASWGDDTGAILILQVPDEVAAAEVSIGAETYPTVIIHGTAVRWLSPDQVTSSDQLVTDGSGRQYTWHAYDASGTPIDVPLSDV